MRPELVNQKVAVQARSRSEYMVETLLRHKGYDVWVPSLPQTRKGGRSSRSEPLFPGYVFCTLVEPAPPPILATPGVLRFAGPGGRPEPIPPSEIAAIQTVLASGLPITHAEMQLGRRVEVVAGPLKGCCGTVVEFQGAGRLLVGISLLQRTISVAVERDWLRPLPELAKPARTSETVSHAVKYVRAQAC